MKNKAQNLLKSVNEPLISNFIGIPKSNLTWQEVFDMDLEAHFGVWPDNCPNCGEKLIEYESDYQKIEDTGQFMVRGIFCPNNDFTFLDCA